MKQDIRVMPQKIKKLKEEYRKIKDAMNETGQG